MAPRHRNGGSGIDSMKTIRHITVCLAFVVCLAFAVLAWLAYLLFACPAIGARRGWIYAGDIIKKEMAGNT